MGKANSANKGANAATDQPIQKWKESVLRRTYWVIEFTGEFARVSGTNYACIRDVEDPTKQGFMDWTNDIHEAIQFAREVDADRFSNVYWWSQKDFTAIREHMDVDALEAGQ